MDMKDRMHLVKIVPLMYFLLCRTLDNCSQHCWVHCVLPRNCHNTVKYLHTNLNSGMTQQELLLLTCQAQEFTCLPARIHDCILIR